ncbi:DUF2934 domain-containing protein [Arenibaculum pallidiluteum]|uniref:DUF2934 domain-containing protein n=1 Tax=Arenibaculum pallidiluteum TaxID=2812559 RepID=UPI001F31CB1F|nr:DUF2934 domain-containing protein [Arenibaculum pallidiluteum]
MDRNERIAARAYAIWEKEGRPEGRDVEHWHRAADEIAAEERSASGLLKPITRKVKATIEEVASAAIQTAATAASKGIHAAAGVVEEALLPKRGRTPRAAKPATSPATSGAAKPGDTKPGSTRPAAAKPAAAKPAATKPAAEPAPARARTGRKPAAGPAAAPAAAAAQDTAKGAPAQDAAKKRGRAKADVTWTPEDIGKTAAGGRKRRGSVAIH